jgi:hypothetical protein
MNQIPVGAPKKSEAQSNVAEACVGGRCIPFACHGLSAAAACCSSRKAPATCHHGRFRLLTIIVRSSQPYHYHFNLHCIMSVSLTCANTDVKAKRLVTGALKQYLRTAILNSSKEITSDQVRSTFDDLLRACSIPLPSSLLDSQPLEKGGLDVEGNAFVGARHFFDNVSFAGCLKCINNRAERFLKSERSILQGESFLSSYLIVWFFQPVSVSILVCTCRRFGQKRAGDDFACGLSGGCVVVTISFRQTQQ